MRRERLFDHNGAREPTCAPLPPPDPCRHPSHTSTSSDCGRSKPIGSRRVVELLQNARIFGMPGELGDDERERALERHRGNVRVQPTRIATLQRLLKERDQGAPQYEIDRRTDPDAGRIRRRGHATDNRQVDGCHGHERDSGGKEQRSRDRTRHIARWPRYAQR